MVFDGWEHFTATRQMPVTPLRFFPMLLYYAMKLKFKLDYLLVVIIGTIKKLLYPFGELKNFYINLIFFPIKLSHTKIF